MLQNDMGNTLIQDSKTGHIMGLSEGFVPVGLKEHGGIMYIASVNKEGKGEIGTIPSPILTLSQNYPNDAESHNAILVHDSGPDHNLTILSDYKIAPGEKFLIGLNLNVDQQKTWYDKPIVTCFNGNTLVRGMYNIKLYTVYDTNSVCLDKLISTPQKYWVTNEGLKVSNYWFIPSNIITNIDINKTYIAKEFKTYPGNIPAGRLAIKVELENIDSFSLMKSIQTQGVNAGEATLAPRVTKNADGDYILDFPGFDYKTSSARFVGKVEYCLYDQKTKQPLDNTNNQQNGELQVDENSTFKIIDRETLEEHYHIRRTTDPIIPQPALFSYNIGSDSKALNNWYQIVVTYYDQFGGKIDTYKYSFNPYHILNFEENYSLEWKPGFEYEQLYNTSNEGNVSIFTEEGVNLSDSISIKAVLPTGQEFTPKSDNPYIKFSHNYGPEGGSDGYADDFAPVASLNTRELDFHDNTYDPVYITLPSVNNLNYLYNDTQFKFTPIDETSKYDITWWLEGNLFLNEYSSSLFSVSVLNRTIEGSINTYPYSSELFTAEGQSNPNNYYYQVQSIALVPSIVVDNKYDGQPIQLLTNLNVHEVELYDGNTTYDESGKYQESGITNITISAVLKSNTQDWKWQLILSNTSDYTIIPNFSLYGDSDTKFDMAMGLDRNGLPQPAWTFGQSLLTFVDLQPTSDHSSFVKTVEYLPETYSITQIIYPGTYLLNLNAYSDTGSVVITIDNENPVDVKVKNRYFTPQLIYISKDTKLTLSWSGIQKLRNIGLYQLSKPVWNTDRTQFGENKVYDIKDYQHDSLDVKSEVIIPLQASYYETALCYTRSYEYYTGPVEAYMTDRHKLADGTILNFVYMWDSNNSKKAQVDQIPTQPEEMSTLTYRNEKQ